MTIKYITPKDAAHLTTIQAKAITSVNKARDLVQIALVATILHIARHGDRTVADQFVSGLGNTVNSAAVVEYLVTFGGLTVNDEGTGFGGWQGADYIKAKLDSAKEKMWWELKRANPFKGYNADAAIAKLVKDYKAMQNKAEGEDADKINLTISEESIKALLSLTNFEVIISGDTAINDELANLEALVAADAA